MAQTRQEEGMQITADMVRDLFGLDVEEPEAEKDKTNISNFKVMYDKDSGEQFFIGWNEKTQKMDIYPASEELLKKKWQSTKPAAKTEMFNPEDYQHTAQRLFDDWHTDFESSPWKGGEGNIDQSERRRLTEGQKIIADMNANYPNIDSRSTGTDTPTPYKLYFTERLTNLKETLEGKLKPTEQRRARQYLTSVNAYVEEYEKLLTTGRHPIFVIDSREFIRTKKKPDREMQEDKGEGYVATTGDYKVINPTLGMLIVNPMWSDSEDKQNVMHGLVSQYPLERITEAVTYLTERGMPIDILLSAEHLRNSLDSAANMLDKQTKY